MVWGLAIQCGDVENYVDKWGKSRFLLVGGGVENFVEKMVIFRGQNGGVLRRFWRGILGEFWVVFGRIFFG